MNKNQQKMLWAAGWAIFHGIATYALQYVGAIAYAQEPNALPILATFLQLPGVVVASLVCMIWGSITPTSSCGVAWPWIVYPANLIIIFLIAWKCIEKKGKK
ncbi:hypothetical protein M0Q28_01615 [Patescibacteria group bacterium]|jgi:hypothetical protein|nr:hypothetical protein [Patescibacteria group bacterium]